MQRSGLILVVPGHEFSDVMFESLRSIGRFIAIFLKNGCRHTELLMLLHGTLMVDILSVAQIQAKNDSQGLAEMLFHLIYILSGLTPIGVGEIGCTDGSMLPFQREAWADDAHRIECMGDNAEKSLYEGTGGSSRTVGEVSVALATGGIKETDLPKIGRTAAKVHLVEHVGLEQLESLAGTSGLEVSQ